MIERRPLGEKVQAALPEPIQRIIAQEKEKKRQHTVVSAVNHLGTILQQDEQAPRSKHSSLNNEGILDTRFHELPHQEKTTLADAQKAAKEFLDHFLRPIEEQLDENPALTYLRDIDYEQAKLIEMGMEKFRPEITAYIEKTPSRIERDPFALPVPLDAFQEKHQELEEGLREEGYTKINMKRRQFLRLGAAFSGTVIVGGIASILPENKKEKLIHVEPIFTDKQLEGDILIADKLRVKKALGFFTDFFEDGQILASKEVRRAIENISEKDLSEHFMASKFVENGNPKTGYYSFWFDKGQPLNKTDIQLSYGYGHNNPRRAGISCYITPDGKLTRHDEYTLTQRDMEGFIGNFFTEHTLKDGTDSLQGTGTKDGQAYDFALFPDGGLHIYGRVSMPDPTTLPSYETEEAVTAQTLFMAMQNDTEAPVKKMQDLIPDHKKQIRQMQDYQEALYILYTATYKRTPEEEKSLNNIQDPMIREKTKRALATNNFDETLSLFEDRTSQAIRDAYKKALDS